MKRNKTGVLWTALGFLLVFLLWTLLICRVDVQAAGPAGTRVGFAAFNTAFHRLTGVHMTLYAVTDWLGLFPICICLGFGVLGVIQLLHRKSLRRVDPDILMLGIYYVLVILAYLFFEAVPINYRPILIDGHLEASYPSSTTLLVLSVLPTLRLQASRRCSRAAIRNAVTAFSAVFSICMVLGRLISGVHWATDIIGAVFLSLGLYLLYRYGVEALDRRREKTDGIQ